MTLILLKFMGRTAYVFLLIANRSTFLIPYTASSRQIYIAIQTLILRRYTAQCDKIYLSTCERILQ